MPNTPEPIDPSPVQFPLSVFFDLTGIAAIVFMFSNAIGLLSSVALILMALSILFRLGMVAAVSFGLALITVPSGQSLEGTVICVVLGGLIACWPIARAAVSRWLKAAAT